MGLNRPVLKAVLRKGYKIPTPIQRKCIPPIMDGRDVVAMARTGSGKSAAFLLPLIHKLKIRHPKAEIRALILSPTRELAIQTLKFVREFTKYTDLVSKLVIGGESIGQDFETVTSRPDILIATPGRLAHVLVEMKQKLDSIEIVVFDEADRLFEPGFKEMEQVNEICSRLNDTKQTLLFSATMPQRLAEFAKAGLKDPIFIRLDVEANLSETLKSVSLHCSQQDKFAVLLHLLKNFVDKDHMTVVFMPTRHHIEYCKMLLDNSRLSCCWVYSSMDPEARRINVDRFVKKQCCIMLVTDIAARGIDIPLLDIVINFNFPSKPKLFVHRVGRVARAGRFGCAISLVSHDETPYLHALHMFLDQPITLSSDLPETSTAKIANLSELPDKILGSVPQEVLDDENEILKKWHEHNEELLAMVRVCENAMKPYLKTREPPQTNSVKVAKDIHKRVMGVHPIFRLVSFQGGSDQPAPAQFENQVKMLDRIKSYKPQSTIFEVGHIKGNHRLEAYGVMLKKRQFHDKIAKKRLLQGENDGQEESAEGENTVEAPHKNESLKEGFVDSKFYIKYQPDDYVKEKGLEVSGGGTFNNELSRATLDLVADNEDELKRQRHGMMWDRKKKKYVTSLEDEKKTKKIRTESGAYISASYSSGLYEKWKSQSKVDQRVSDGEEDDDGAVSTGGKKGRFRGKGQSNKSGSKSAASLEKLKSKLKPAKRARRELKNPEEIMKARNIKEKREAILRIKTMKKAERKAGVKTPNRRQTNGSQFKAGKRQTKGKSPGGKSPRAGSQGSKFRKGGSSAPSQVGKRARGKRGR